MINFDDRGNRLKHPLLRANRRLPAQLAEVEASQGDECAEKRGLLVNWCRSGQV